MWCILFCYIEAAKRRPLEIVTVEGEYSQYSSGVSLSAGSGTLSGSTGCVALGVPLCHKHRVPYSHSLPGHEARADEIAKFEPMVQIKVSLYRQSCSWCAFLWQYLSSRKNDDTNNIVYSEGVICVNWLQLYLLALFTTAKTIGDSVILQAFRIFMLKSVYKNHWAST